ncbi:hypothetical protein VB739_13725 [Cyanobium gracile UHCC 0281]|uniref:Uncharacterized protein n=1 Tax=Cyanobium gracile UHCC 0281 TaxID=3110309 RepID=A0ABU5SYL3_9CYAN|nr:hypothetical protein [Cyanobium gracile UHCC 0281]
MAQLLTAVDRAGGGGIIPAVITVDAQQIAGGVEEMLLNLQPEIALGKLQMGIEEYQNL